MLARERAPIDVTAETPEVAVHHLTKEFDGVKAVDDVSLEVARGEFVALLGPSGCGKTTTLRAVAGFVEPTAGSIVIRGRDITDEPPNRRNTAMVFQSYALFPHLTVFENVAFGLRMRRAPRDELARRVEAALSLVQLTGLAGRYPRQLSGGQQQRVALARALVVEPDVLLLDEPLSNLDAKLREEMRGEIRELVKTTGATALYVTHDQAEALAMADRVVVMNAGRIAQVGTPVEIYERPHTLFVATFIGDANLLPAVVERADGAVYCVRLSPAVGRSGDAGAVGATARAAGSSTPDAWDTSFSVSGEPGAARPGETATVMVRPERVLLQARAGARPDEGLAGRVIEITYLGSITRYMVRLASGLQVRAHRPSGELRVSAGETVAVGWATEHARLLPSETEP